MNTLRMPMRRRALSGLLLGCLLAGTGTAAAATPVPPLQARTLGDRALQLPADLAGRPALLVIGYSRGSRAQTSAWRRAVAEDARLRDRIDVYQVVALESVPRLFRAGIVAGIRREVPASRHDRFLVVTDGEPAWKAATGYEAADAAYLLLVDGDGIVWRGSGVCSDAALAALRAAVAAGGTGRMP